jgi:hypothetical protein
MLEVQLEASFIKSGIWSSWHRVTGAAHMGQQVRRDFCLRLLQLPKLLLNVNVTYDKKLPTTNESRLLSATTL